MDTVWMRLTVVEDSLGQPVEDMSEHFMFGNMGITKFSAHPKGTALQLAPTGNIIAVVAEDQDLIFNLIAKIRGTHGKSKSKATSRTRKTSASKAKK